VLLHQWGSVLPLQRSHAAQDAQVTMKFEHGQDVQIKITKRYGKIAGFCHYTHPNDTWGSTAPVVHQGAIVDLDRPYYDRKAFIRMVVVPLDKLIPIDNPNAGWGDEMQKDEVRNPLFRHMTNKVQ
jgi:hypothetical protein